jgi:hypothetical protein
MLRAQREKIEAEKEARAAQAALERAKLALEQAKLTNERDDNTGSHLLEAWKVERAAALSEREELAREREVSKRERETARLAREALHHAETAARLDHEAAVLAMQRNSDCIDDLERMGARLYQVEQRNVELAREHAGCPGKIAKLERDIELLHYTRSERPPAP